MSVPAKLMVPQLLWQRTMDIFESYTRQKLEAGCFWYGLRTEGRATALSVGIPRQENRPRNFQIDGDDLAILTQVACEPGLVAVAQIHLHPGTDVRHSPWDDEQIVSRNIYSLVLPNYGKPPVLFETVGVHRFESGRWTRLATDIAETAIVFTPTVVDTR
jgi:hypothetical protein